MSECYELATRIFALDFYEFTDNGATIDAIAETIRNEPETVVKWLLDFIEIE